MFQTSIGLGLNLCLFHVFVGVLRVSQGTYKVIESTKLKDFQGLSLLESFECAIESI